MLSKASVAPVVAAAAAIEPSRRDAVNHLDVDDVIRWGFSLAF